MDSLGRPPERQKRGGGSGAARSLCPNVRLPTGFSMSSRTKAAARDRSREPSDDENRRRILRLKPSSMPRPAFALSIKPGEAPHQQGTRSGSSCRKVHKTLSFDVILASIEEDDAIAAKGQSRKLPIEHQELVISRTEPRFTSCCLTLRTWAPGDCARCDCASSGRRSAPCRSCRCAWL